MAGSRTDVELTKADGKTTSVLKVLDMMKARYDKCHHVRERAKIMERFFYGRLSNNSRYALETIVNMRGAFRAPPVTKNKLKNLGLSFTARVARLGETTIVFPGTTRTADVAGAEVANAVLDWQRQTQDRDALLFRRILLAVLHGTSAGYSTWDPDDGPHMERMAKVGPNGRPVFSPPTVDPATGVMLPGDIVYEQASGKGAPGIEALSIFDFVTDGAKDVAKDGHWLLVKRYLDPDVAAARLRSAGIDRTPTAIAIQPRQINGDVRELVEGYEMWWRPGGSSRFPDGFFACVVDGDVCDASTYPYKHGRLPLSVFRLVDVEGDFWGATWLEDAVPLQIGLNHSLGVVAERMEVAGQVRGLGYGPALADWGDAPDGMIDVQNREGLDSIKFVMPVEVSADMYQAIDRFEKDIGDVAAVSEVASQGDAAAQTGNARLVDYATQVDQTMSAHTVANLNECTVQDDANIIDLVKQFVTRQRLFSVVGEDLAVSADYFAGSEIGDNIRLEAAPASTRSRMQKRSDAQQAAAAGQMDPTQANEVERTGLDETLDVGAARETLAALIEQGSQGQAVQADPSIPPAVAIPDLKAALGEMAGQNPQGVMAIRALLHEYEEMKSQAGAAPALPMGKPQGQGASGQPMPSSNVQQGPASGAGIVH